jgi:hypothetical protein
MSLAPTQTITWFYCQHRSYLWLINRNGRNCNRTLDFLYTKSDRKFE